MSVRIVVATVAVSVLASASLVSEAAALDYEYFKSKVQPIFVAKRPGHAPCVMCHAEANNMLRLQKLPLGKAWSEDDTRRNFDTVSKIVEAADDPLQSKILMHPLAPEAGGDAYHNGGRQFEDKDDPSWKIIADWARGATLTPEKK
jgi:hypothetical protein